MTVDVISALVRALSFIAVFQAIGMAMFLAAFCQAELCAASRIKALARISANAGILFVGSHYVFEAARLAGEVSGILDPDLQRLVLDSSVSKVAGLRMLGLALVLVSLSLRRPGLITGVVLSAGCIIVSFTLIGHTAQESHGRWLGVLLAIHLAVVMFWFGSLLPLMLINRAEAGAVTAAVVERFSRVATWIVPALFVAGLVLMVVLIGSTAGLFTTYGIVLLGKIGAFAVLMGLAAINRWRLGPRLATDAAASRAFQRSVLIEYVLIAGVLAATAVLTTFFSPE